MGRAGVASFGNGRRDRRMQYNGNASFTLDNSALDARSYSINGQDTAADVSIEFDFLQNGRWLIHFIGDGATDREFRAEESVMPAGVTGGKVFPLRPHGGFVMRFERSVQ